MSPTKEVGKDEEKSDPDEDLEASFSGRRTYRVADGRPAWVQPLALVLPLINSQGGGVEVGQDQTIRQSMSADCWTTPVVDRTVAEVVVEPVTIHESESAEYVTACPKETYTNVADPLIHMIHHSTTEDYQKPNSVEADTNTSAHEVTDLPIHHSDAADYVITNSIAPHSDRPIHKFQAAVNAVETVSLLSTTTPESYHEPPETISEDRINDDPYTVSRTLYIYDMGTSDTESRCKAGGMLNKDSRKTKFLSYLSKSGSCRHSSYDPGQRVGENRTGSSRKVNLKDSAMNRKIWKSNKSDIERGRKTDRDGIRLNRKLCNTGSTSARSLMTSSVTTMTHRPYSAHSNRSSSSLGAKKLITSSKPEPEIPRHLAVATSRVGS